MGTTERFKVYENRGLVKENQSRWVASAYECAEGVKVTLSDGSENRTIKTDNYGDFEFEGLTPNSSYTIRVEHKGYASQEMTVQTRLDMNLGEIILQETS